MKIKQLALAWLLLPCSSFAGTGIGKVTVLLVNADTSPNYATFSTEIHSGHPCGTPNTLGKFAIPLNEDKGKQLLSLLLSAEARGVSVFVGGGGNCIFQNREDVNYVYVGNPG